MPHAIFDVEQHYKTYDGVSPLLGSHAPSPGTPYPRCRCRLQFFKRTTIPGAESELNLHENIFGASDESDALQNNRLKKDHPLGVPFLVSYALELH